MRNALLHEWGIYALFARSSMSLNPIKGLRIYRQG